MSIDITSHLAQDYPEVSPHDFYREIFPAGELDTWRAFTPGKYVGIIMTLKKDGSFHRRYTLTDEFHDLDKAINSNYTCFLTPAAYAGKKRESRCARVLYALAIDLDYVDEEYCYRTLTTQIEHGEDLGFFGLPRPTFLVSSGTGIHIYYVLQEPVPCYSANLQKLQKLKSRLTWQAWTQGAAAIHGDLRLVQYEPILQAHRMVGSITKIGTRARAFRTGVPITVEEMDEYVPEEHRAGDLMYKSNLSLGEARQLYPEWYERRVVQGEPRGTWTCHEALYLWWIRQIREGATEGHRYWCIFVLIAYAQKSGVSRERVRQDAYSLVPFLDQIGKKPFTRADVDAAFRKFDEQTYKDGRYKTYPLRVIEERTNIRIKRNKRNGRTRKQHVKLMTLARDLDDPTGEWRKKGSKRGKVQEWRKAHPYGTQAACAKDLGITWQTVHRHWAAAGEPMTNAERVQAFRQDHPDGSKAECARATGLSRQTVYKYWQD